MDGERQADFLGRFRDWVGEGLLAIMRDIRRIAKRRDLPLLFNAFAAASRPARIESQMLAESDGFLLESEMGGLKGLAASRHRGKIAWRYTHPHTAWPRLSTPTLEQDNAVCGYETILWGGTPIVSYAGRYHYGTQHAGPVARMFADMARVRDAIGDARPFGEAAVVDMHRLFDRDPAARDALAGAYLGLLACGTPATVLPREALLDGSALADHAVVLLPTLGDVSGLEIAVLSAYVAAGGGLIAAGELPEPIPSALVDLLGIARVGPMDTTSPRWDALTFFGGAWDVYVRPAAEGAPVDGLLPVVSPRPVQPAPEAEVMAWFIGGDAPEPLEPAVLKTTHGKGVSVYAAFDLGRSHAGGGQADLSPLLDRLLREASPRPGFCRIRGDRPLAFSLFARPGRTVIQLLNTSGADARVTVELAVEASAVRCVTTGEAVGFRRTESGTMIDDIAVPLYRCLAVDGPTTGAWKETP